MNTDILDKKIIVIDSTKCNLKNNNTYIVVFGFKNQVEGQVLKVVGHPFAHQVYAKAAQ